MTYIYRKVYICKGKVMMKKVGLTILLCAAVGLSSLSYSYAMLDDGEPAANSIIKTSGAAVSPDEIHGAKGSSTLVSDLAQVEQEIEDYARTHEVPSDDPEAQEIPTDLPMRRLLTKKAELYEALGDLDQARTWREVLVTIGDNTRDGSLADYSDEEYQTHHLALAALERKRGNEGKANAILDRYKAYAFEKYRKVESKD